jgi:hypothetical protein
MILDGINDGLGRMAEHRARVSKAEINVLMAIDICDMSPLGSCDKDREWPGPSHHPVHRNAGEKRFLGSLKQST